MKRAGFLKHFILFGAFLSLIHSTAWAGSSWQSLDPDTSLGHFPSKLAADLPHLFIPDNLLLFSVGGMVTAQDWVVLDSRDELASSLQAWKTQPLFDFGDFYGEGWVEGGSALAGWGAGALIGDAKLQGFGRDAVESLIDATALVSVLKVAVGRERPNGADNHSFPSGHAITAFCFAPVVQKYWGWEAGIPAYLLATVTALARVEGYHHYLSDVMAGAVLGVMIGNAVVYTTPDLPITVGTGEVHLTMKFD